MSFYSILLFRGAFNEAVSKARLPPEERDSIRAAFAKYIAVKSIFNQKVISTVYVSYDSKFYVDETGYAELAAATLSKFGLSIEPVYQSVIIDCISITTYESFDDVVNKVRIALNNKESQIKKEELALFRKQMNQDKKELFRKLSTPLPHTLTGNRLLAIDFEYDQNKNHLVFECGITKSFNGVVEYEHYLVEEHYKTKKNYDLQMQFKFGESKIVSMSELLIVLRQALEASDYLVGHCLLSEYLVLEYHGLNIFDFEQLQCMDTQSIFQTTFNSGLPHSNISLVKLLALFDVVPESLHNAGNDAAYTMMALTKMAHVIETDRKQNPDRRRRIDIRKKVAKLKK